ncbi:FtsX-like permease family protein [uncultured Paludibaculum sp.]|uniref:ABC transporter permease n=1 Tax=uncultured Paludibaculum sp. TaxID=1765020 RepID=UPI002AAC224B|nr:FtsX-like permease family protein [uncultured Paludibaculum sp.]
MFQSAAWRMAWREARASAPKFVFVIFGVAAGVGALTGVRGFSAAFHEALRREARTLMAADLTIRQFTPFSPAQDAEIQSWLKKGAQLTRITETVSMLSAEGATPALVSVKAVDPNAYPYYGKVRLDPEQPLSKALTPDTVAVSDDLLLRLNLSVGSTVKLGEAQFRVCGVVRMEPDRMTGSLNVGPRIMITREGLDRTGLMTFGSRASHRFLFKLPAQGIPVAQMFDALKKAFPESMVVDYRDTHPLITRALDRSTTFLSLVSLIALIVGALGVATAIYSHIQQRLDTIAILKCLGARSSQVIRIYTLQTLLLGLTGGLAGVAVGGIVQRLFPILLARYFQFQSIPWNPSFAVEGILAGVLVTLLFTIPPLLAVRQIKPALIFRREMAEVKPKILKRLRMQWPAILSGLLILGGLGGVAAWLAESVKMGSYFVGGLAVALLLLAAVAWLLLRGLKLFLRWTPVRLPVALRHGMANLYRPGNHATSVLVALGIGVMFTLTIYLVQKSLLVEVAGAAPKGSPNVLMINITSRDEAAVKQFLDARTDLTTKPTLTPLIAARLLSINGTAIEDLNLSMPGPPGNDDKGGPRRRRRSFTTQVTWSDKKLDDLVIRKGAWWKPGEKSPVVSVSERTATNLRIEPGNTLHWSSVGREFDVKVVSIHRVEAIRFGGEPDFIFNPAALEGLPTQWFGAVRLPPAKVSTFQRDAYKQFPTVTVINAADVMNIVQEVVDQVALVIRFISAFAILAGAIILASTVAGTRLRRSRESAVLKTIGARRNVLVSIFSVEFAILGAVAGLMGGVMATVFARVLLLRLLDARFQFELLPNAATIALTTLLAVVAGWTASIRILKQRPLEVLRDE